jgi:hypothetical protein
MKFAALALRTTSSSLSRTWSTSSSPTTRRLRRWSGIWASKKLKTENLEVRTWATVEGIVALFVCGDDGRIARPRHICATETKECFTQTSKAALRWYS